MDGIANHFRPKSINCRIFHIQSQISPRTLAEASPVLGDRHQFQLGLFIFHETTTDARDLFYAPSNLSYTSYPTVHGSERDIALP